MIPQDYEERVYAGVLGKVIGVYVGRPFEGWSYESLMERLGEINYYVHETLGAPLIVTDDDITGTFTFIRALADHGNSADITAKQIGWSWRNYLIEGKTILWWGGMGMSTEHTAFMRLKAGIEAPESGSIEMNGRVVAEQIGAQIFIDGWGMVCPGNPKLAVELAGKAGSVSHDGEAIYAAQVIAAIEALAFVESNLDILLDTALSFIPADSIIAGLINDVRQWCAKDQDWHQTFQRIKGKYGYDKYGGNCHVVPNHGLIIMALIYGGDDFQKALMVVNTAGWDTDCNSANVGCIMGLRLGLAGIDSGVDWRGPVADRVLLPTADGSRSISDCLREAYEIAGMGRKLAGLSPVTPKDGARFHFSLPGSVQGWMCEDTPECKGTADVSNENGTLLISYKGVGVGRHARVGTSTFIPISSSKMGGYELVASPTLFPGQTVRARVRASAGNTLDAAINLYITCYEGDYKPIVVRQHLTAIAPGVSTELCWTIPDVDSRPIAYVGIEVNEPSGSGAILVDSVSWSGVPNTTIGMPAKSGSAWRSSWASSVSTQAWWQSQEWPFDLIQNEGVGMLTTGEYEWTDYSLSTKVRPHLADTVALLCNVRGLVRYVGVELCRNGMARLIERYDGEMRVLAEAPMEWEFDKEYHLSITTKSDGTITAKAGPIELDGKVETDRARGAIGFAISAGHTQFAPVTISPLS